MDSAELVDSQEADAFLHPRSLARTLIQPQGFVDFLFLLVEFPLNIPYFWFILAPGGFMTTLPDKIPYGLLQLLVKK